MITLYKDELLYSYYARRFVDGIYYNYRQAASELFGNKYAVPSFEFETKGGVMGTEIIRKHTMLPYYEFCRGKTVIPKMKRDRYLKFCPVCCRQQEPYWNRKHQTAARVCYKHGCYLCNSPILISGKTSPDLIPAGVMEVQQDIKEGSDRDWRLAVTLAEWMEKDFCFMGDLGAFFTKRLGSYVNQNGVKKISRLYQDFCAYWDGYELPSKNKFSRIFENRFNMTEVAMLTIFLNIPKEEIITGALDVAVSVKKKKGKSCRTGRDWKTYDRQMLPKVKQAVREILTADGRPKRISVSNVCEYLGISDQRFKKMPRCKTEVMKQQETYPEYWAREIIWAVETLKEEGKPKNWVGIRRLTNIRKENVRKALPILVVMDPENDYNSLMKGW